MKFQFCIFLLYFSRLVSGQSADSILCHTEDVYRSLAKYKDEGIVLDTMYGHQYGPFTRENNYFFYCNRQQHIDHWVELKSRGNVNRISYVKPANDTLGVYTSFLWKDPIPSNITLAGARMTGSGSLVLSFFTSLLYDEWYGKPNYSNSFLLNYDSAYRLSDTTMLGVPFYIVQTKSSLFRSQAMIDRDYKFMDSIRTVRMSTPLPEGFTIPPTPIRQPFWNHNISRYYIRQSDLIIHRYIIWMYEENQVTSKRIHFLNPTYEK